MATKVIITPGAQKEFDVLPVVMKLRVAGVFARIAKWPAVSGAKPLRGELAGNHRIRTGAYRVVFKVSADGQTTTVWKIGHRGGVYD
jgi:mRNA-degrading endonuclease RelE of RelBE toxin-antitoxin system